jgi:hypothetical protein
LFQIETGDDPEKEDGDKSAPNQESEKPVPKKQPFKEIELPQRALEAKDVDNYVGTFFGLLEMCRDENEAKETWKEESKNRIKMAITPNSDEYKNMKNAVLAKINVMRGN